MQREASEQPGKLRIFHVLLRLITVVSRLVPFPTEHSTRFVALSYGALRSMMVFTSFYYVCHLLLRLSRRVKLAYHGDKFLHIGAFTIVNNTDHTLHYAIEEEVQSRTFLINSAVGC